MTPTVRSWLRLLPFAATGALAAGLGFLPHVGVRIGWFVDWAAGIVGVALLLATLAGVAALGALFRGPGARERAREALVALVVAGVLVTVLRLLVPAAVRTEVDESFLGGVAYGLHLDGAPVLPVNAVYGPAGAIEPLHVLVDVRGIAFPMVTAVVHAVRGFDGDNGLHVNAVLSVLALLAMYALARQVTTPAASGAAMLIFCTFPAVAMSVASANFEPVNLLMVALVTALALRVRSDDSMPVLIALLLAVPVLAQGRYESVLLGACALAIALPHVVRARSPLPAAVLALVPLLLLPFAWQRAKPLTHAHEQIGGGAVFSVGNFVENGVHLLDFLVVPSQINPAGPLAFGLALVALVGAWRARDGLRNPGVAWLALGYGAMAVLILAYVWGDVRRIVTLRYTLPFLMVLAIAAACGLTALLARWRHGGAATLLVSGAALACAAPTIERDVLWNNQFAAPALNAALVHVRTVAPRCRPLFATPVGIHYVLHGYDGVAVGELERDWERFRRRAQQGLAGPVLVVGMYDPNDVPFPGSLPPPGFAARRIVDTYAGSGRMELYVVDRTDAPLPAPAPDCAALDPDFRVE